MKCSKLFDYFKRNVILNGFSVTLSKEIERKMTPLSSESVKQTRLEYYPSPPPSLYLTLKIKKNTKIRYLLHFLIIYFN